MINICKLTSCFYSLYYKGRRVAAPLTRAEMVQELQKLEMDEEDIAFLNSTMFGMDDFTFLLKLQEVTA